MRRPRNIQTERLTLLVLLPGEIEALLAGDVQSFQSATGVRYPQDDPSRGVDLDWHLKALRADGSQIPWRIRAIIERSSNMVIGSINLKGPPGGDGDVEIGWGLNDSARGKGYATEAAAAVLDWVFQQPGVSSVSATIPDDNPASQHVAHRLGLTRTGETRRDLPLWRRER